MRTLLNEDPRLTFTGDERDVHESPAKRAKNNNGSWRPLSTLHVTQTSNQTAGPKKYGMFIDAGDQRHSSPSRQIETTPSRTTYLSLIHDALKHKPEGLTSSGIIQWLYVNRPSTYREFGEHKLRTSIPATLSAQAIRKKRTVWQYEDPETSVSIWKLGNIVPSLGATHASLAEYDALARDRSSESARDSQGEVKVSEAAPAFETTLANMQNIAAVPEADNVFTNDGDTANACAERPPTPLQSKIQIMEADTDPSNREAGALALGEASGDTPSASVRKLKSSGNPETRPQNGSTLDGTAGNVGLENSQTGFPRDIIDDSKDTDQEGEEEPDYGSIVRELRRMKRERKTQELEIEAERSTLPDIKALEKDAGEALEKAAEQVRLADEARKVSEMIHSKLEAALAASNKIAVAEEKLEQLTQESKQLRNQLDID